MKAQMMSYVLEGVFNDNLPELISLIAGVQRTLPATQGCHRRQDQGILLMWR